MRKVHLALGDEAATTTTQLVVARPRELLTLRLQQDLLEVDAEGVARYDASGDVLRFVGVTAGARIRVTGRTSYRSRPHGLARLVDAEDGSGYVVGSGALGGAAHFVACEDGPDDRMPTTLAVDGAHGTVQATGEPDGRAFVSRLPLASHHLGLVAGPWRRQTAGGVSLLTRRTLDRPDAVGALLGDVRRVLAWLTAWFGGPAPWGDTYTQVLLPDPPWLAMEHPGCVLLSERLLGDAHEEDGARARRMAVLAHEAAHQWLGNLVSPRTWADVGVLEGAAELLGQLACEALLGEAARPFLTRRRAVGPLAALPREPDATTAGLAEVAGPAQHAELLRDARDEIGPGEFRTRVQRLCRRSATIGSAELWAALGVAARQPARRRLPVVAAGAEPVPDALAGLATLAGLDPATAVVRAREAFLAAPPGLARVRTALAALTDPAVPPTVAVGLGAELVKTGPRRERSHGKNSDISS